jgi:acyl-CoA thioesterase
LWSFTAPAPGREWLTDLVAFDHDRVRVEIVDTVAGEDPRATSVKRFPTWGDGADLIDMMDLRLLGERRYVSAVRPSHGRAVVEASQLLGQAVVAAMRHTGGRRVVSSHLVVYRVADPNLPLEFELAELTGGRTFSAVTVQVSQAGRRRATASLLLGVPAPDVVRHEAPAPPAAGPYDCEPYDMSVTGRDLRFVDAAYDNSSAAPVGPPVIDAWVRFRSVPADPALHAGLLAQFTGHVSIAAALRPHAGIGQDQAHRTLSTGISGISLSLHADIRADQWLRYHHHATFAGEGMTHSECRVYTESGALVASFSVDATLRGIAPGSRLDDRTAI